MFFLVLPGTADAAVGAVAGCCHVWTLEEVLRVDAGPPGSAPHHTAPASPACPHHGALLHVLWGTQHTRSLRGQRSHRGH